MDGEMRGTGFSEYQYPDGACHVLNLSRTRIPEISGISDWLLVTVQNPKRGLHCFMAGHMMSLH